MISRSRCEQADAPLALFSTTTRAQALGLLRGAFTQAGIETPELDARILVTQALALEAAELAVRPDEALGPEAAARLLGYAERRLAREPVGRIIGCREFWGLPFWLSPETLEPRPDTETLVETALSIMPHGGGALRILDLGTGSGCLLVALLHERREATGVAIDRSFGGLTTARHNAVRNGVADRAAFVASNWGAALDGRFDLVVSNPPYIASSDLTDLAPEVRDHDPAVALDGGRDGLAAYRTIFDDVSRLLTPHGALVVEIGSTQEEAVRSVAEAAGLVVFRVSQDLAGLPRAVVLRPSQPRRGTGPSAGRFI